MAQLTVLKRKRNRKKMIGFLPREQKMDLPIFVVTLILLVFGLVMLYSASYVVGIYRFHGDSLHYISDQLVFAAAGLVVLYIASRFDYKLLKNYSRSIFGITIIMLIVVLFMPEIKGVHRWIIIPKVMSFQPSEIAKFSIILSFAKMVEANYKKMKSLEYGIVPFMMLVVIYVGLLFLEPHLSCIMIIVAVAGIMMFTGGSDIKYFVLALVTVVLAVAVIIVIYPEFVVYAKSRIVAWLHPEEDLLGDGYQTYQSLLAIGSGGLLGMGLGNGRQKHLHLPEPQNDFIFAVTCEELGFIGASIIVVLFTVLVVRCLIIAMRKKDIFGKMLIIGICSQIGVQTFLNMAVCTATVPNTGISLPFFSEGGTSLLMLLAEIGVVLSVSRENKNDEEPEESEI